MSPATRSVSRCQAYVLPTPQSPLIASTLHSFSLRNCSATSLKTLMLMSLAPCELPGKSLVDRARNATYLWRRAGHHGARPKWIEYFTRGLAEAEKELAGFENCVAKHGLRVFERDVNGERDVTGRARKMLQDAIDEYRRCLRDE